MLNFPEIEKKILKFWQENKIFEKSLEKTQKGSRFVFFEGPPFANGLPGIHHLLSRAFKDIILRYKTMQGFCVERRAGWDTHGLPTEMEAEKKLNIKSKKEIEKFGIEKFVEECKKSVFTYKKEWEEFSERIGFWLDFKNAYITCSNDYIETLWWILKQIWQKGLLYQDYKVVPYCPRCGTSLSSHEVAQGYKTIKENSIYVKFPVKGEKNTYLLVWTTTPWTLPGNVLIAANPQANYVKIKLGNDYLILAESRLNIIKEKYEIIESLNYRKNLFNLFYEPLYSFLESQKGDFSVIGDSFVSLNEGSGFVHIAPAFGENDMRIGKERKASVLITVDEEGKFKKEVKNWAGVFVKDADPLIVKDLKERNLLFAEELYEHEYPFCWRCDTPLLYYAKNSWFIKTTGVKEKLIKNSEKINWIPEYIKEGRFGDWLKEVKDWNLSRERYWGTPLPIWKCEKCEKIICIGSLDELKKLQITNYNLQDLHRPFIDSVVLKCGCGGEMKRVPEVIDCWFDSGAMPFAQWHYPFENKEKIDKKEFFPADFIAEGIDQTRGWFYTLLAVSTLLNKESPYKNVICLGLVLDAKSQKMSKSKGNIVSPKEVIEKFGADCARLYFYTINQAGDFKRFDFKEVQDLYRKFFDILWQSYKFLITYGGEIKIDLEKNTKPKNILDCWIISLLENLNFQIIKDLDKYDVVSAARKLVNFTDNLSNWYIRRSRSRFQRPETEKIKEEAINTLQYALLKIAKLSAPFTPFFSEEIYQRLDNKEESIHLTSYPVVDKKLIDQKLEEKMEKVRQIVGQVLAERAALGIKVRQPLASLKIKDKALKNEKELLNLIKDEVNVKEIVFNSEIEKEIELNTDLTDELREEGVAREIIRNIQGLRKEIGLIPSDRIISATSYSLKEEYQEIVKRETGSDVFEIIDPAEMEKPWIEKELKILEKNYKVAIEKKAEENK